MGRVVAANDLPAAVAAQRAAGKSIVLTNGCFDLLHVGHVRLLQACRRLGDVLVVGVNADGSVRRLKGTARPFVPQDDRAELLAAVAAVDYVTIFPEPTAEQLVEVVKPDVYVKGADYARASGEDEGDTADSAQADIDAARLPEAAVVRRLGGRVVLVPLVPDRSTSGLVARIRAAAQMDGDGSDGVTGVTGSPAQPR
jgi:rfaE bifunctional protein nucleotidyltransferase chain/domain